MLILERMFFLPRMEIYYKLQRMTQSKCVDEPLESLVSEWDTVLIHLNIKLLKSAQCQADMEIPNLHILQTDFAISYYCEYQNEIQSALWSHQKFMLFIVA